MSKAQEQREAQAYARDRLRELLNPGDTVYLVLTHVARSGMQRRIMALIVRGEPERTTPEIMDVSGLVARAIGWRYVGHHAQGVVVNGTGMDMGFHLVYTLAGCLVASAPTGNAWHPASAPLGNWTDREVGYALTHRWL